MKESEFDKWYYRCGGRDALYAFGGWCKRNLTPKDFPEVSTKISQRQNGHTAGTQQLEERGSVGFVNSASDAQKVLDAYHSGQVKILGKNGQGFPVNSTG